MDPRQPMARATSTTLPQTSYHPNMASAYAMSYTNTHLPPIQSYPQPLHPQNQNYMPQQYRPELPRYQSAPTPTLPQERYNHHVAQQNPMGGLPPNPMLPQPNNQSQQAQSYSNPPSATPQYQQRLAPAPPRPLLNPLATSFSQPEDRPAIWTSADAGPNIPADVGRDPTRTHVVGSQGRRGILPSAPGRPPATTNGVNGSPKSSSIPMKDADGKFPCSHCNKTYLHAKHLKRHMLRHTGDRPYMCVLCNDTFSRSDILKRHFQKCSVRRGNPTGASHLSNPAAHLKKSQAAAAKANADSPASAATPSTAGLQNGSFTSAPMGNGPLTSTAGNFSDAPPMPYSMAHAPSNEAQRPPTNPPMQSNPNQNVMGSNPGNWSMQNSRNNMMFHSTSTSPDHFAMGPNVTDDKRNIIPAPHHMAGDEWNHMFHGGGNDGYMNPMFGGYDSSHNDVKKEYEHPENNSNGYYMAPTNIGPTTK